VSAVTRIAGFAAVLYDGETTSAHDSGETLRFTILDADGSWKVPAGRIQAVAFTQAVER
jgi:hypothetical protein